MRARWLSLLVVGRAGTFILLLRWRMRCAAAAQTSESYSWELLAVSSHVFYQNWGKNTFSYPFVAWTEGSEGHFGERSLHWLVPSCRRLG